MMNNGVATDVGVVRSTRAQRVARRVADLPPVDDRGERAESLRQCEAFRELIQRCARTGAGSLTPLQGGVRYLSADGTVMVTISDRRWM